MRYRPSNLLRGRPSWSPRSLASRRSSLAQHLVLLLRNSARTVRRFRALRFHQSRACRYKPSISSLEVSSKSLTATNENLRRELSLKANKITLLQSLESTRIACVRSDLSSSTSGLSFLLSKNSALEDRVASQDQELGALREASLAANEDAGVAMKRDKALQLARGDVAVSERKVRALERRL